MIERVSEDIKEAMKQKNRSKLEVLRMLKSRLLENQTSSKPQDPQNVIIQYSKQLQGSLESYPQDSDAYQKIVNELKMVEEYMPQKLSEGEVRSLIVTFCEQADNFGAVMKMLAPEIKGRFDGKKASEIVKEVFAEKS
ncbi:MAG: GatB/YqeY domain-containing protein [Oligoflexales bacterium]